MLHLAVVLLTLSGVLSQDRDWRVMYPDNPLCAVRGFSVSIPCSYSYPQRGYQVVQTLWCSNPDKCHNPPYVHDSSSNTESDFEYAGDDKSNCTLLLHNVQFSYSGEYRFRFITNVEDGRFTGEPGVTLQVADLKVSLIRLGGDGTLKPGDSLVLLCDVNCTHTFSQFSWSKNNQRLPQSGRVLQLPALTARDSGKYTCTWETNETSGYDTISLHVEGAEAANPKNTECWPIWVIVWVTAGAVFITLVILGAVIYSRRFLCDRRSVHAEQQKEDDSAMYGNVQQKEDDSAMYGNVQQKEDDSAIYNNV